VIISAIEKAGYKVGKDVYLGLDVASSEFFKEGRYELESEKRSFTSAQFSKYLAISPASIPSSPSRTAWRRRLGGVGTAHRALGEKSSSWVMTCS